MSWRSKTYEVLPALSVRRDELRRTMRIATVSWLYGSAWAVLVSGVQLKNFGRMIGFNDFDFSLLAASPAVATLGMIVASELIERSGLRKYQFLSCGLIHRLLWLVIAAIPLIFVVPSRLAVVAMLLVYTASWVMSSFASPAWTTWMGDLVPKKIRGRYFASRMGFGRVIQVLIVVAIGLLLDHVTVAGAPETAAGQPKLLMTICIIFVVGAILGAAEIIMYRRIREVVPSIQHDPSLPRFGLLDTLKDLTFRRYIIYAVMIGFATAVPGFYFLVYTTESLGFSKLAVQVLYMVISPILGMIGLRVWGRLIDRWGRRPVLAFGTFMTVFSVTPYFFSTPSTPCPAFVTWAANGLAGLIGPIVGKSHWVWLTPDMPVGAYLLVCCSTVVGGMGWTGVMMGQSNFMLAFSDKPGRTKYIAAAAIMGSFGAVLGSVLGGQIVNALDSAGFVAWYVGPFIWGKYHATFFVSFLGRIVSLVLVLRMGDPGSGKIRDMVRSIRSTAYTTVAAWLAAPLRAMGIGRHDDEP